MQVQRAGQQLPALQSRLRHAAQTQAWRHLQSLAHLETRLQALDPQRVLERGYAWLSNAEGLPVLSAAAVQPEQAVQAVLADGVLRMRVTDVLPRGPTS